MSHPARPADPATHRASLRLTIDGTAYRIRPGTTDDIATEGKRPWIARPGWHLTKRDGTSYFVHARGDHVVSCTCEAFRFSRRECCKHIRAFQAFGILPK